ncbi:MAG: isopentenyl phosphate kinase [Candidatus Thorarchaeota archaeon]
MEEELTILKLGGSLITDKSQPYTVRHEVLQRVSQEVKECLDEGLIQGLILIHGVGSYGHPPVLKHKLHKGYLGSEQLLPLSRTQSEVAELRNIIVKQFQEVGVPICLMYPSSMLIQEEMQIVRYFFEPLKGWVDIAMVPLLGGDIIIDPAMGWSVGSGDQMAVVIARELGAKRLLFACDVSGVYDTDPKTHPDASLMKEVNLNQIDSVLEEMGKSDVVDASGAMKGKLNSIVPAKDLVEAGSEVSLFSMMEYGNLEALLKGEDIEATDVVVR